MQTLMSCHNFDVLSSPFVHDQINFENSYEKMLTSEDYDDGYVVSKKFHYGLYSQSL